MGRRRDGDTQSRIVIVCDQKMMDVFADGWYNEKLKEFFYHWYEIRHEMIDILKHGSKFNIFILGIVEPSDRFTSLHKDMLPHMLAISLFYYQPVTNEKGTMWVEPHPNHYVDVFSITEGDDRIIGKLPCLPENEQVEFLARLAKSEDAATTALRFQAKTKIPQMKIGEDAPEENLPLWKRIGLKKQPIEIKPGDEHIGEGPREDFWKLHHAPKFETANGNGKNGTNGQAELEIEKK
jgi:hypothetical protein